MKWVSLATLMMVTPVLLGYLGVKATFYLIDSLNEKFPARKKISGDD